LSGIFDRLLTHPNFIIQIYAIRGIGRNGFQDFGDRIISIAQDNPTGILNSTSLATLEMLGIEMPDEDSGDDELLTNETAPEGVDASPAD
jgi:hypothetical protein